MKSLSIFAAASLVTLTGCMHAPIHDGTYNRGGSYNSNAAAVPIEEVGARAAKFSNQAQQFHKEVQGIEVCANGVKAKKGGGKVTSGLGDNNGKVTYTIDTTASNTQECN